MSFLHTFWWRRLMPLSYFCTARYVPYPSSLLSLDHLSWRMTATRLWRSSLRSILPLFRYSTHSFLLNSAASEETPAKLAEAGQVRVEVNRHYDQLLTRYLHIATVWHDLVKTSSFCIGALSESLQKDCLCPPQRQRNYIIHGLSVKNLVRSEFWTTLCFRMVSQYSESRWPSIRT